MKIYKISARKKQETDPTTGKKIPKECTGGDCYVVSGKYMFDNMFSNKNLKLAHGMVTGQGKISGIKYDHAWVEDGDTVIDKSCNRDLRLPKALYYALGNIENVKFIQRVLKLTEDGKFGPKTEKAVKDFQKLHNLKPDGIVGPKTWAELGRVI